MAHRLRQHPAAWVTRCLIPGFDGAIFSHEWKEALPEAEGDKADKKKFKTYPIGYFHIDIAEVQTAEGKLYLYVAIDRTSKFAFVQLVSKTGRTSASAFLVALIADPQFLSEDLLGCSKTCSFVDNETGQISLSIPQHCYSVITWGLGRFSYSYSGQHEQEHCYGFLGTLLLTQHTQCLYFVIM
jgi:hypothetical protein